MSEPRYRWLGNTENFDDELTHAKQDFGPGLWFLARILLAMLYNLERIRASVSNKL